MVRNISAIRLKRCMEQKELAEKAKVDLSWLNKVENGKATPSLALLQRLADVLDVEVKDFF